MPPSTVIGPVKASLLFRVSVPEPTLVRPSVRPSPSSISPLNVVLVLSPPTVSVSLPLDPVVVTKPLPVSDPMLWLKPPRLSVPLAVTLKAELGKTRLPRPLAACRYC